MRFFVSTDQRLYMKIDASKTRLGGPAVIGFLKVGTKKLYVRAADG